ncbi:MAG: proline dehydrogenase family protein [Gemmatimonadales bacterium]
MSIARSILLGASRSAWLREQMSRRAFARRAVKRFMPGEKVDDALEASAALSREGLGAILTQLGENLTSLGEADAVRNHYLGVLDTIKARGLPAEVSVKPTQLGLDLSAEACSANIDALAARANSGGGTLWIDMEDSSYVDRTLDLYKRLRAKHQRLGICLQAYLRRTPADLAALLPLKPAVRLVKGAYAERPEVAFPAKADVDAAYHTIGVDLLAAAAKGGAFVVFGTHDLALLGRLTTKAAELGVKDGAYEIHMLYGIRAAEQRALAKDGRKVRCLISYGSAWFAWYMRRLAERPANVWFVLKSLLPS